MPMNDSEVNQILKAFELSSDEGPMGYYIGQKLMSSSTSRDEWHSGKVKYTNPKDMRMKHINDIVLSLVGIQHRALY